MYEICESFKESVHVDLVWSCVFSFFHVMKDAWFEMIDQFYRRSDKMIILIGIPTCDLHQAIILRTPKYDKNITFASPNCTYNILTSSMLYSAACYLLSSLWTKKCLNPILLFWHLGCKYHLVIEDDKTHDAFSRCEHSPVPLLLAGTSDQRHFSVCTEHAPQQVISCKPDWRNSLYYNKGRWRKVWTLDSSQPSSSDTSLRSLLTKVILLLHFSNFWTCNWEIRISPLI